MNIIQRYVEQKDSGNAEIVKVGRDHKIVLRRFCPMTGAELPSEEVPLDHAVLEQNRAFLQSQIDGIDEILCKIKG